MKRAIVVLLLSCIFLTSCTKNDVDTPVKEVTSEQPDSNTATTDTMVIVGTWEDSIATKQRTEGVSDEEFSNFTDEEKERYYEEFGTTPGITLDFHDDGTITGNIWSDAASGEYELDADGTYNVVLTTHDSIKTVVVEGDSMTLPSDMPVLSRVK